MKTRYLTLLLSGVLSLCILAAALLLAASFSQGATANEGKAVTSLAPDLPFSLPQAAQAARPSMPVAPQPLSAELPNRPAQAYHRLGADQTEAMRLQAMSRAQPAAARGESLENPGATQPAVPQSVSGGYLNPGITVDATRGFAYGYITPYTNITIVRQSDGSYGAADSDGVGFFWTSFFNGNGDGTPIGLGSGDTLLFTTPGGSFNVTLPQEATGSLDLLNDSVSGVIPGDAGGTVVTVTLGLWNKPSTAYGVYTAFTQPGGAFSVSLAQDIGAENFAIVDYRYGGVTLRTAFIPSPKAFLLWQNSYAGGYAEGSSNVTLTVFQGSSTNIRWQGSTTANYPYGWYQFDNVEIAPGDHAEMAYQDGSSTSTTYTYASSFNFDTAANTVTGLTEPGEDVHVVFYDSTVHETSAVADGTGWFTAAFNPGDDLRPRHRVDITIHDDLGNDSLMISGPPYLETQLDPESDWDCVMGRVDTPNAPLTLTVETASGTYTRTRPIGPSDPGNNIALDACYLVWGLDWGPINFAPGDIVTLRTPTWEGSLSVGELTWQADTANERLTGSASNGEITVEATQWNADKYPAMGGATAGANATPAFTAQLSGYDLRDGGQVTIRHYNPASDFANGLVSWLHVTEVDMPSIVTGHTPLPDEAITAYLYDNNNVLLASTSNDVDTSPYYFRFDDFGGNLIQPGYRVELSGASSWTAQAHIPAVTINGDIAADLITGEAPKTLLLIYFGTDSNNQTHYAPVDGYALNTAFFGHDLSPGDFVRAYYTDQDGSTVRYLSCLGEVCNVETWSNDGWDTWIWGNAEWGTVVTITTPRETFVRYAEPTANGGFGTGYSVPLYPGETFTVTAGAGTTPVVAALPDPYDVHSDSWAGTVSGQIGSWNGGPVEVEPWGWNDRQTVNVDPQGYFSVAYDNMPNDAQGAINLNTTYANATVRYHRPFHDLALQLRANYAHEWVEGNYPPGHTIWITLTNSLGEIKDTASGVSGPLQGWGNDSGFATWDNLPWASGTTPDLQVGDYVYGYTDAGYSADLRIGEIDATLDTNTDLVSGNIYASWLTSTLNGGCGIWIENGTGMGFENVDPDGGYFACDFTTQGFDIQPGMDVGVNYNEPGQHDGDQVINVVRDPAPHLWLDTWGEGTPAEGSNYILYVQYKNDGDALASGVTVEMTLLEGMTYLSDTSGLPVSGTGAPGDPLVWQVGVLDYDWNFGPVRFNVFVQVTGTQGQIVHNQASIATTTPYYQGDPWRMQSEWQGAIEAMNVDLTPGIGIWTWDPAPGYDYVYDVSVCNKGGTNSADVTLTDSLPMSSTLVTWWGQMPGWEEVSASDHELVVHRPSVQGNWCGSVYIRAHLDAAAWQGMELHNHVEVSTANDLDPNDNSADVWHNVGSPHTNLTIWKNWIWGEFVSGGRLYYEFSAGNTGNLPVSDVVVTATIPAGTTFMFAYEYTWDWQPFPPDVITDQYVVWHLGEQENGYGQNIGVVLGIDPDTPVGTQLPMAMSVSPKPGEDRYDDNQRQYLEVVNPPGPNLRLDKHNARWSWEGSMNYELRILNLGTTTLNDFWITDTLPLSTTVEGIWQNHGPGMEWFVDEPNHQVKIHIFQMDPENTASMGFDLRLDDAWVGVQGLAYTNTVESPVANDVYPADNSDTKTLYTGPDVFVSKWLSEGEPRAGEVVTFTVEFGNTNLWPWNGDTQVGSHITDTLPEGLTFVRATAPWDPNQTWEPESVDGQQVVWGWGTIWADSTWSYQIVAQVNEGVPGNLELANSIEAYGDSPDDIEPDWTNNATQAPFTSLGPNFQVSKAWSGSAVAGTVVTYTLNVDNTGNESGSSITVSDVAPEGFTYLGGGDDFSNGVVTWNLPSLGAGSQENPAFWGTVSCTPGTLVLNELYRVEGSDQGISSALGEPLGLAVSLAQIEASFDASTVAPYPGEVVTFNSTSTTNGTALSYEWDFGDGETATGAIASHAFASPGTYEVTLTATDGCGYSQAFSLSVEVGDRRLFLPIILR